MTQIRAHFYNRNLFSPWHREYGLLHPIDILVRAVPGVFFEHLPSPLRDSDPVCIEKSIQSWSYRPSLQGILPSLGTCDMPRCQQTWGTCRISCGGVPKSRQNLPCWPCRRICSTVSCCLKHYGVKPISGENHGRGRQDAFEMPPLLHAPA